MRRIATNLLLIIPLIAFAEQRPTTQTRQSFESCGLITSEYLTVVQLAARGFDAATLKKSLPAISDKGRKRVDALIQMSRQDGLIDTYSTINSEYAHCAKSVFKAHGLPEVGSREARFHRCAGENKIGYEILLAALVGANPEDVYDQLHSQHIPLAEALFSTYRTEGALSAFDGLASELKYCLKTP